MTIVILLGGRDSSQLVGHNITFVKYIFGKSSNQFDRPLMMVLYFVRDFSILGQR